MEDFLEFQVIHDQARKIDDPENRDRMEDSQSVPASPSPLIVPPKPEHGHGHGHTSSMDGNGPIHPSTETHTCTSLTRSELNLTPRSNSPSDSDTDSEQCTGNLALNFFKAEKNKGKYQDIGLDYLFDTYTNKSRSKSLDELEDSADPKLDLLFPFTFTPEELVELDGGSPSSSKYTAPAVREDDGLANLNSMGTIASAESEERDLRLSHFLKSRLIAIVHHKCTKYLIGFLSVGIFIPFNTFFATCFGVILGIMISVIFYQCLDKNFEEESCNNRSNEIPATSSSEELKIFPSLDIQENSLPSQGWMIEHQNKSEPPKNHIRMNQIVFVRLQGSTLCLSYPKGKPVVPKRRLFSDPPISTDVSFSRHIVYDISGGQVFLVPEQLASHKAWNNKYPIGIRLSKESSFAVITQLKKKEQQREKGHSEEERATSRTSTSSSMSSISETSTWSLIGSSQKNRRGDKQVAMDSVRDRVLYLFARTDREKDIWYRRFVTATAAAVVTTKSSDNDGNVGKSDQPINEPNLLTIYMNYMRFIVPTLSETINPKKLQTEPERPKSKSPEESPETKIVDNKTSGDNFSIKPESSLKRSSSDTSENSMPLDNDTQKFRVDPNNPAFFNALVGRILFDIFHSPDWTIKIQTIIQKKFDSIKIPKFIDSLVVRELCLGNVIPVIQRASSPVMDAQGLWIDMDLTYEGNFALTIETKLNLVNSPTDHNHDDETEPEVAVNNSESIDEGSVEPHVSTAHVRNPSGNSSLSGIGIGEDKEHISSNPAGSTYDSDSYDSGESSEEEFDFDVDDLLGQENSNTNSSNGKRKKGSGIFQRVKKSITAFFKPEMASIRKAITNATDTPLILSIEVTSGSGTLTLNIPPPPTDRIWYGFRTNPNIQLVVKPKLGDMEVNLTHLTDWITKKILHEMARVVVLPNMDDLTIPVMEFKLPTV